jgi:hypothetical protein
VAIDRRPESPSVQASLLIRAISQALMREAQELRRAGASYRSTVRPSAAAALPRRTRAIGAARQDATAPTPGIPDNRLRGQSERSPQRPHQQVIVHGLD